jgi:hypothetical protein
MGTKLRPLLWAGVALAAAAVLVTGPASTAAAAEDANWGWTTENPNPSWWTWGEEYETSKPVRGGYYRRATSRYIGLRHPNHWPVNDWVAMAYFHERAIYRFPRSRSTACPRSSVD